jgi:hypothetical protein
MAAGAHGYLTKPLDMGEFLRVVAETKITREPSPACVAA